MYTLILLGFAGFIAMGAIHYFLPKVLGRELSNAGKFSILVINYG